MPGSFPALPLLGGEKPWERGCSNFLKWKLPYLLLQSLRADLQGTIFVACDNGLRQAHDMIYDCCVRQKKCRSILKHVLKRCNNHKSCRRPVVRLSHATKIVPRKSALTDLVVLVLCNVHNRSHLLNEQQEQITLLEGGVVSNMFSSRKC